MKINLEKYPAYEPSGVEWLGEIPKHWEIRSGFTILFEAKEKNIGMKRSTVLSLSYGNIRVKEEDELTGLVPESFETYQFVNKGDIIFRPTDLQNDHVSLRSGISDFEGIITSAYLNLRLKPNADNKFYSYFFRGIDNNKVIYGLGSGLRQNIDFRDFKRFKFPVPPLPEQTAIAAFLDRKTALIEQAIGIKQKQIELLKERRQILIHKAVTRGIGSLSGAETPNIKLKDSGVEWIGEIPVGWEVKRLKYLANVVLGKMLCNVDKGNYQLKPYLKSKNIQWLNVDVSSVDEMWFSKNELIEYRLKKGDLVLSEGGEVGKTCIWNNELDECYIQNSAHKVTFHANNSQLYYLYLLFTMGKIGLFEKIVNRVSIGHLTKDKLINTEVIQPPMKEQLAIANWIESTSNKIDTAITLKEQEIEKLKEYKATLINSAVTGKIKVDNDDK